MEIVIDKRIELITIVQTLCNYWENLSIKFNNKKLYQCKYKENVKEYFERYKGHEAVKSYDVLCQYIMDISAFLNNALCYSDPPELDNIANYEYNFGKIYDFSFLYEEFINELRQFYKDTDFDKFYENNKDEYTHILNDYGGKSELSVNTVLDYLGSNAENYNVIIAPLVMGNFGIKVKTNKNEMLNYSVMSPYDYKENKYIFGPTNFKKFGIWHEIGHLTINDLTSSYINEFNVYEKHIPEIFVKNFYTTVETIINEYIIRAITIRLFETNGENEFAKFMVQRDTQKGFINVVSVKEYIKKNYEENNKFVKDNRYRNLIEYLIHEII
jgi:hypothetical protein